MKLYLICGKADSGKNFFGDILKKKFEEEGKKALAEMKNDYASR